jgi:hypothetical protein
MSLPGAAAGATAVAVAKGLTAASSYTVIAVINLEIGAGLSIWQLIGRHYLVAQLILATTVVVVFTILFVSGRITFAQLMQIFRMWKSNKAVASAGEPGGD